MFKNAVLDLSHWWQRPGIQNTPNKLNFGVIMGKKKETKGAEVGVKPESIEFESKGAEGGLKIESASHGSNEPQEDSTGQLVSYLSEALKRSLESQSKNRGGKKNCKTAASVFSRAKFQNMDCAVHTICQPGAS